MMRPRAYLWCGGVIALLLVIYAGTYLHYRRGLAFVHRVTWSPTIHTIELNGERGQAVFWEGMISADPAWKARCERDKRGWQALAAFFLPLRWLECRWWDLTSREPAP